MRPTERIEAIVLRLNANKKPRHRSAPCRTRRETHERWLRIRDMHREGLSPREIAAELRVVENVVHDVLNMPNWQLTAIEAGLRRSER